MISASLVIVHDNKLLKELSEKLSALTKSNVEVGFLGGKAHQDSPDFTVAEIATVHEFGSDDGVIPERPFMRQTFEKNGNYVELLAKSTRELIEGQKTSKVLFKIGETVRADMVKEIGSGDFTPLAESTVAAKGSSKPLIDTGFLRNSIEWRLVD